MKIIKVYVLFILLLTLHIEGNTNTHTLTWKDLGIGIHNAGEITDWTYYGVKTPQEASKWIEALKPLGNISYAGATRIWKQDGFTVEKAKAWVDIGVKTPEQVRRWLHQGIESANEAQAWIDIGIDTPNKVGTWKSSNIMSYAEVRQWQDIGIKDAYIVNEWSSLGANTFTEVKEWKSKGIKTPQALQDYKMGQLNKTEKEKEKKLIASFEKGNSHSSTTNTTYVQNSMNKSSVYPTTNKSNKQIAYQEYDNRSKENSGLWNVFLLVYFIIMIITMFKGAGKNRTIIVFRDYNDLGLTFLIPAGAYLMFFLFASFGGNPKFGMILAMIVALVLFGILIKNSYEDNEGSIVYTIMAIMTKMPLGILWLLSFFTMLNPSGKTAKKRRESRASAMMILAILTPLIGILVVNKEGSYFNPKEWIKGRRVGSIRTHL